MDARGNIYMDNAELIPSEDRERHEQALKRALAAGDIEELARIRAAEKQASIAFEMEQWDAGTVARIVGEEMARQDERYGTFDSTPPQTLLALACIRMELGEAEAAWQQRHNLPIHHDSANPPDWFRLRTEVLQIAAIACRLLRDIGVPVTD